MREGRIDGAAEAHRHCEEAPVTAREAARDGVPATAESFSPGMVSARKERRWDSSSVMRVGTRAGGSPMRAFNSSGKGMLRACAARWSCESTRSPSRLRKVA